VASKLKKILKDVVKRNPEPARGTNYVDPGQLGQYSAQNQVSEDMTTSKRGVKPPKIRGKEAGEPRSSDKDSPTLQHVQRIKQAEKHYLVKTPPGALRKLNKSGVIKNAPTALKTIDRTQGSQTTQLTPEETQMNEAKKTKRMSGADRWRKHLSDIDRAHKEFMKSIEHLPHKDQTQAIMDKIKANRAAMHNEDMNPNSPKANFVAKELKGVRKRSDFNTFKEGGDLMGDPKAAEISPADGANGGKELADEKMKPSRAKMIKMIVKNKMVKEDLYDHEKEDKSVQTYGKKPKFDKADKKDSEGEKKPSAAAIMTGGTTLTGEKRDTVEIDPMMRNRPGQPDVTKKDDKKKDDKKEEKKKDK